MGIFGSLINFFFRFVELVFKYVYERFTADQGKANKLISFECVSYRALWIPTKKMQPPGTIASQGR